MTEIHHHYSEGTEVQHITSAGFVPMPVSADGTPDADTTISAIVGAASCIASALLARNFEKNRGTDKEGRGQYKRDTICRISVEMAEKIHAAVHATVHGAAQGTD
jgi:hypothetical protein